jgi:4-methyl-5(b-hydroxyethyl)-thiazole monophosphate biosynthesis
MKSSYLFLAEGFEEIEALAVVDVMRRAGMELSTVSVTDNLKVKGAHGIEVVADTTIATIDTTDTEWLICPGGMPGATNLAACAKLTDAIIEQWKKEGNIAAICASPAVVLAPLGVLNGCEATCYPSFEGGLEAGGATPVNERVVVSDNIITANGPSSAVLFGLAIVAKSLGQPAATSVASGMLL